MDGRVDGGHDGIVAGQEAGGDGMRCPSCGFENLIGADTCDNCGADLAGRDIPQQAPAFHGQLLGEHLDELGAPPPIVVSPDLPLDAAIARMHEAESDCVLVVAGDRLVGIFTDRDAVVKAAGKPLSSFRVRDFMTPDPVVLRHDDPIAVAIHKMAVGGFRHIPIVEDGRPTGVVTARDVFHHLAKTLG
ncbi:MAG: CBS domain-containing protein [Candidatus Limnocylindrales bacterium]